MGYSEIELADYIVTHYANLLTLPRKMIWKQYQHFLEATEMPDIEKILRSVQRYSSSANKSDLTESFDGDYYKFIINCSRELLNKHGADIVINTCPQCGQLARTPLAKQCKHCFFNWH